MPTINKKHKILQPSIYKGNNTSAHFYNTKEWHNLRNFYYSNNPLCECCLRYGVYKPATEVHHKKPFLQGKTEDEKFELLLDYRNLMSVCNKCHKKLHNKLNRYNMKTVSELTKKEYECNA